MLCDIKFSKFKLVTFPRHFDLQCNISSMYCRTAISTRSNQQSRGTSVEKRYCGDLSIGAADHLIIKNVAPHNGRCVLDVQHRVFPNRRTERDSTVFAEERVWKPRRE